MWKKRHLERFRNSVAETDSGLNNLQTISALNVKCDEVLLTDKVLRVEVKRWKFEDLIKHNNKHKFEFNGSLKGNKRDLKSPGCKVVKRERQRRKFNRLLRSAVLNKRVPKINKKYLDFIVKPNGLFNNKRKTVKVSASPVKKVTNNKLKSTNNTKIKTETKVTIDGNKDVEFKADGEIDAKTKFDGNIDSKSENDSNTNITLESNNNTDTMETNLSDTESNDAVYCLNVNLSRCGRPRKIKRNIEFPIIAKSLKEVKLPGDEWKIEIRLKSKVVNQIAFVNKKCNRSVNFSRIHNNIEIMFNDSKVSLIGAPRQLETIADLSILLDIVHHINPEDPIVKCENDKFA